ncbi:hypothetical protein [Novosphingobium lindaniclasticum]|uniref:Sulfotransferase family protein n=1 Tax=Novosphingobium lindaniclasticum LE124 TaxID=1096930 RepID=T0IE12_9SPHN|nr:hypothetical protein [Novosphingobium lindaniclasticum]EQB09905.1 hypothetical protein L284_18645 [Novosphingobium lindaniclasticum LE124]
MKAAVDRLLKPLGLQARPGDPGPYWPRRRADRIHHPFLFLLTPPGAGTTAMARHIAAQSDVAGLHPSFEGQRLVRGLMDADQWLDRKFVDYEAVLGAWSARIAEAERSKGHAFFLEKSPPHLVRYEALFSHFSEYRVALCNRSPLTNIDAQLRRYALPGYRGVPRERVVRDLARQWIWRSELLRAAAERHGYPLVTYERFRRDPGAILSAFGLTANREAAPPSQAEEAPPQVLMLSTGERRIVSETVAEAPDLLAFFGYAPDR